MKKVLTVIGTLTWGLPITLIGFLVFLFFLVQPKTRYHWFRGCCVVEMPYGSGGFSLGWFIFLPETNPKRSPWFTCHEYGHSVQVAVIGPFYLFIIIMSIISFWTNLDKHDTRWFERWADKWGGEPE